MPGARLPMRKIRDMLRLTAAGMSSRKIASRGDEHDFVRAELTAAAATPCWRASQFPWRRRPHGFFANIRMTSPICRGR